MPTYTYRCPKCDTYSERFTAMQYRHAQQCGVCSYTLDIVPSVAMVKVAGAVAKGGGFDRFTADMLGIPLKELPEPLKTNYKETP